MSSANLSGLSFSYIRVDCQSDALFARSQKDEAIFWARGLLPCAGSTTLNVWKKYGLWPPSEQILSGGALGEDLSRNEGRNGLKFIRGGASRIDRRLVHSSEITEREILQGVKKILDSIEVHHKEWTGGRNRKYSTFKTRVIAGRLPIEVINQINRLKGSKTFHLERALRLYVMVMKETV